MKMRSLMPSLLVISLCFSAAAHADTILGKKITLQKPTNMSEIFKTPQKFNDKELLVEGSVVAVCEKRGCWMELAAPKGFEKLKIKVNDGEIIIPFSARGSKASAQGVFTTINLSLEETQKYLEHRAEEEGKKFDPKSVTSPMTFYQLNATSIVIKK